MTSDGALADIAVVGLAVMGQNLILNMESRGFRVCAFNRSVDKVERFLREEARDAPGIIGATSLQDMVAKLKAPRRVMLLVKAGRAVDELCDALAPLLAPGDIVVDGGNSEYADTARRCRAFEARGLLFVGAGVSGGEEGARRGPSLMPGGHEAAWPHLAPIFRAICAKADGEPCCDWVGPDGAGHFVKMVHNGIEYGDMQLICEAYHLMQAALGMTHDEMAAAFDEWNGGVLDSFLIEITRDIMRYKDDDGEPLLPKIRDSAGQKGTGKWTAIAALEYGTPVTLIGEAVFARCLSALKDERQKAGQKLKNAQTTPTIPISDRRAFLAKLEKALYASKIVSYAQGFMLLREAAKAHGWKLNYGGVALMWRGGCIIRSRFLGNIKEAYARDPDLTNLLVDDFFAEAIGDAQSSWREVVSQAVLRGVPVPAMSSALAFFDGYRSPTLPANLLQAQRDYFGAHTYELLGREGTYVHTNWTGRGGQVSASTYNQ